MSIERLFVIAATLVLAPLVFGESGCSGNVTGAGSGGMGGSGASNGAGSDGSAGGSDGSAGGSDGSAGGSDGSDGSALDAPADALACGSETCGAKQICVHPCCGGAAPPCVAEGDGGACPPGFHSVPFCAGFPGAACQADPCSPPPPFCKDKPIGCPGQVTCGCLPLDVCNGSSCGFVNGPDVNCVCA